MATIEKQIVEDPSAELKCYYEALKNLRAHYARSVRDLSDAKVTLSEVQQLISKLYQIPVYGPQLEFAVNSTEEGYRRKSACYRETIIDITIPTEITGNPLLEMFR